MKKIILSLAFCASTIVAANAQTMTSKNGTPILPEAGDWSIGLDVVPILSDAGNLFHGGGNNTLSQVNQTLVGLYVKDATTAYRVRLRIGLGSQTIDNTVQDDASPTAQVTDELKQTYTNITLGAGIQKSRGKGRLHGIYGAEIAINFASADNTFTYGNAYTSTNQNPTTTDFSGTPNSFGLYPTTSAGARPTEIKSGSTFGVGLDAFIGAEYFFAPKMSLSAEYNWGLFFNSTGAGTYTQEAGNGTTSTSTSYSAPGKVSAFALDVTNAAQIVMHFYF